MTVLNIWHIAYSLRFNIKLLITLRQLKTKQPKTTFMIIHGLLWLL